MTAGNSVACDGRVRMTDVGTGVDVIDRGRDVELFTHEYEKSMNHKGCEVTQRITGVVSFVPFVVYGFLPLVLDK
jgi:hypothetical protein